MPRIAIVESPGGELGPLADAFAAVAGEDAVTRIGASALLDTLADVDLVLVDRDLGDGAQDGWAVLRAVREIEPLLPVVMVAAEGGVEPAKEAIEAGASDFLVRSAQLADRAGTLYRKARQWVRLVDENRALARENASLRRAMVARHHMVGQSPKLDAVLRRVQRVAKVPRPVLVLGERGTGKELVARAIHEASEARGAFVVVNCASVAESLLESELFGHEKGAFTGAHQRTPGKFELATDGSLFLDEIGNMSIGFQQKILRVIEYGTFLRVGGTREVEVHTRVVAATNADLEVRMRRGEFLPDLYDRLAFEEIRVPPLREREGDVALLAQHFLERFVREVPSFRGKRLSPRAVRLLERYSFPGNVRELKNIVERAVYRDTTDELTPEDLGLSAQTLAKPIRGTFKERLEAFEREMLEEALREAGGNQAEAARRLGLSYHQLRYYRSKHVD